MIRRFSSRQGQPYQQYLNGQLEGARNYWRIAGYFTVSVLEITADALRKLSGTARIVCNSQLSEAELRRVGDPAMKREWGERWGKAGDAERKCFRDFLDLVDAGKLELRVAPDNRFGLVHGKAGVIERQDGSKLAFLGSNNETQQAWRGNYELMWEDDSEEAVSWVMQEFHELWALASPLAEAVIKDMERLATGRPITLEEWRQAADADAAVTSNNLYQRAQGLRNYQQQFVEQVFRHHVEGNGARFLLADQVGLGKTPQMALAAALIGLHSQKPVLIVVPKTLVEQWQTELFDLLGLPSARWDTYQRCWVTENGEKIPGTVQKAPRRIGILSQGLVVHSENVRSELCALHGGYACVVIDEAHRARVKRSGKDKKPNNLMLFARQVSQRTQSMILGTATPVQLEAIEAFDLLYALDGETREILGTHSSLWQNHPDEGLAIASGEVHLKPREGVRWLANPFPTPLEWPEAKILRKQFRVYGVMAEPSLHSRLATNNKVHKACKVLADYSPYVRRIVQRTREDLEREGLLEPIEVDPSEVAISLPKPLEEAYEAAREYCRLLGKERRGTGFLETLLLRRIGSSFYAGLKTAERLLKKEVGFDQEEEEETEGDEDNDAELKAAIEAAGSPALEALRRVVASLEGNLDLDAKYKEMVDLLLGARWLQRGCIIFSQYYETAAHFAEKLSRQEQLQSTEIPVYAGEGKAGVYLNGEWSPEKREVLKERAVKGHFGVFFGTDAASEGLNLQYHLATLINLDAPWSPTRLDQRTGRIRRIGQPEKRVQIANFRYEGSVEEKVWERLNERYETIYSLLGTLPDTLRRAWVAEALEEREEAERIISGTPDEPPLRLKNRLSRDQTDWGFSQTYLDRDEAYADLKRGW